MAGLCTWVRAVLDCLGCAGESGPPSLTQAAIRIRLSHEGQSSQESSSTPYCRKINDSIFELHAPTSASAEMEILFFHGLQLEGTSDPHISTWQSRSAQKGVWPGQWLPEDFPKARILSISYDGSLKRDATSGRMDLYLVAERLLQDCLLAGVGQLSPVILVGHSFGGLVIKQLCVHAHTKRSYRPEIKTFFESVKGIFYFATPHHGSHFASAIEKLSSKEGELLSHVKVFSKDLARLNSDFSSIPRQWLVSGLGEALPTQLGREFNDVVVEEGSARCEDFLIVRENHISICQPEARNSTTYQHLSNFIRRVEQKFTGEPHIYPFSTVRGSESYVSIHLQARERIISGLEDEQGPAVILLHGDPGSGKSVLARFIGESYARSRGAADPGSIFLSVPRISPKLVIFQECGQNSADYTVLLQKLQGKLHPQVHRSQDQCGSGSMCTLPFLMMGRRIVVVLDDVWNPELIEAFLEEVRGCDGAHVKLLVTSRRSDLSDDPEILKVKIEEITYTEAENILASHLGLTSIPQNLQKYAKLLVERSGRHPLALAMVACRITRDRSEDPEQWKAVEKSYSALLRQQLRGQGKQGMHFGSVLNCAYKRSIGASLTLTYEDLQPDARYLLLLIAKSGPSSIPSPVVRMLFSYGVANHHKYSEPELPHFALCDLETSGAMLRVSRIIIEGDVPCKFSTSFGDKQFSYESLGLHDLQKEFLNVIMEEDNESLEKSLLPESHCSVTLEDSRKMTSEELDRATVWILCILWLREDLAERAAEKLGVRLPLFGSLSTLVLRYALEPLTWLMQEDFSEEMIRCAKQVMVQFFLYGGLDDQSLSRLSTSRDTVSATARMLLRIVHYTCHSGKECGSLAVRLLEINTVNWSMSSRTNTPVPLMDVNNSRTHTPVTVRSLVHFMREKFDENWAIDNCPIFCMALPVLGFLASLNVSNRRMILADEDFFEDMRLYICCSNLGKRFVYNAAWPWMYFTSCVNDESSFGSVVKVRESVKGLVRDILTENLFLEARYQSMLWMLSSNKDNRKLVLVEFPDTVTQLVKLLVNSGDISLLTGVAGTLSNLSSNKTNVQRQVREIPGVISKLLTILSWKVSSTLQHNASRLLSILSEGQENRKALLDTVAQLVKLLINSGARSCSQNEFVKILLALSWNNPEVQQQIGGTIGAIPKLVTILSPENHDIIQQSASALLSLLMDHQENKKVLLEVPDIVTRLVKLLVNSGDDSLLCNVARILIILAWNDPDVGRTLSELSRNNLDVQHQAEGTGGVIPKLLRVLSSKDIVAQLVKVLVNSGDDGLLTHFVMILSSVSYNNQDVQHQIGGTAGAIPKLVTVLSLANHPSLQHHASELLSKLIDCQENRKALLEVPDTVARLVKLLVNSSDNCLRRHVLHILIRLSQNNPDVQDQIGGTAGAIPKLVTVLSSEDSTLQHHATELLSILIDSQENRKTLLEVPDTVARLVKLLVNSSNNCLRLHVLRILIPLSWNNSDVQDEIGGTAGAVPKLVTVLSPENDPPHQRNASCLLSILVDHQENRKALLEVPDTVARLVKLLVDTNDDRLWLYVLHILILLSRNNPDVQHQIGGTAGAIPKLVTVLSSETPTLQHHASELLSILIDCQENTKALWEVPDTVARLVKALLEVPDTVARLVKLLVNSSNNCVRLHVLHILIPMSWKNPDVQHQIGGTAGAIPKLVTVLSPENDPTHQRDASRLLSILVDHQENWKALLEVPGTVARLVKILVNSSDDCLRLYVLHILIHLSWNNSDVQHQIGGTAGAIPKLVTVLSSEDPTLQHHASELLSILIDCQENRKALLEVPDTVARLVKLLVNSSDDCLRLHVLQILISLSWNNPDVQHQIGGTAGAILKLVTVLSSENPTLQHHASRLLSILIVHQENRKVLLEKPDTVARLVKLLVNSGDDGLVTHFLRILSVVSSNNPDVQHQIGGTAGAIPKLVTVLSSENPTLQHHASDLLSILIDCQENREAILEVPDTVARLVKLLVNSSDDCLLYHVLYTLITLSRNNLDVQHHIGGISGAIPKILTLVHSTPPRLQANACGLLFALCKCEGNRKLLSRTPVSDELVGLTVSSYRAERLDDFLGILCYLSQGNPSNQSRIGGTPGAISSLLTILLCIDSSSVRLEVSGLLFRLSSFHANRKLFLELPEGVEELVKLFVGSERVELLSNLAGVLNNLLQEDPSLESQIGEILSSNPRRRTSNLYSALGHKKLSLRLRRAMHYEYILFCLRFGFRARKSVSFPGVSVRWDAVS